MKGHRQKNGLARITNAIEAAVFRRAGLPASAASHVHVPVVRTERPAHWTGEKSAWQRNSRAMRVRAGFISQHEHHRTAAPNEVQHLAAKCSPMIQWHPHLAATGIVGAVWN